MATQNDFDFESFKKDAIAGLYAGKKMTGTDGVLAPMTKHFLESILMYKVYGGILPAVI